MTSIAFRRSLKLTADALQLMRTGSTLEKALSAACAQARPEEKAAVQSMLYSCARRAYLCEALIDQLAQRPPLPAVRNLLSAGLCALCDFPQKSYAILNEAVTAAKADPETAPAAGFINACLRRFTREAEKLTDFVNRDPCVRFNAPRWWIERLDREFGRAAADEILAVQKKKPPLTVRVNRRRTTVSAWCETACSQGLTVAAVENEAVVINEAVPVGKIPGFNEGLVSIQDAGAQLAAHLLAPENGDRILDACAAPGGKTAHLLELADCSVTALEVDPLRAGKITENLDRLGLTAEVRTADAADTASWWDKRPFDRILLDAPCTASGIVRRHPDIVLSRTPKDIASLAKQQYRLLEALWPCLKVGGKLLYAVCSVFEEEGRGQVRSFLSRHADADIVKTACGAELLTLMPHESGKDSYGFAGPHDGFFYALITKLD